MNQPLFPVARPATGHDDRFTIGLLLDVLAVLTQHGYPDAQLSSADALELMPVLSRFLYGPREAVGGDRR